MNITGSNLRKEMISHSTQMIIKNSKRGINNVFCEEDVTVYDGKILHWVNVMLPGSQNT